MARWRGRLARKREWHVQQCRGGTWCYRGWGLATMAMEAGLGPCLMVRLRGEWGQEGMKEWKANVVCVLLGRVPGAALGWGLGFS